MSRTMSPRRHDEYVSRRATDRERTLTRRAARSAKASARVAFGGAR